MACIGGLRDGRDNGLQPLVDAILADRAADPAVLAAGFVTENVPDAKSALEGARDILDEVIAEGSDAQQQEAREMIAKMV